MAHRPIRPLDLTELQTLVVCADTGSFAAAGDQLGVSRVAVTKRITNLEALAGQSLLERNSRGVRLTESGARLCAHARVALRHSDEMTDFVAELRGEPTRPRSVVRALLSDDDPADRVTRGPAAQLAEVHLLFEHVFEASATGLALTDFDEGIVIEVNPAICRFLGREREELIGKSTVTLGTWHSLEDRERLMIEIREKGSCKSVPVRARRPDGEIVYGETSAQLLRIGTRNLLVSSLVDTSGAHAADAAQLDAERWRKTVGFATAAAAGERAATAQGATELLVDRLGHRSAAVIVPSAGKLGVIAQSGEGVDWSMQLGDLPQLDGVCRALRRSELDLFGGEWGCVAPIGEDGMLITIAADEIQRDPSRVEAVASIVRSSLASNLVAA